LKEQYPGKRAVGRPRLQYLKQVARNTATDSYTAMNRVACSNYRWTAANQSEDWRIRRRWEHPVPGSVFPTFRMKVLPSSSRQTPGHTALHPRRPKSSAAPLWEPQIS